MKAGLVASIHAMDALRTSGVRLAGDVILASVQGEEDGGLGTFALLQRGWRADACVVAEPTELDVIPANSGSLTFRLRVPGQATHAARRTEGVSAIEKFWPVWQALVELEQRRHEVVDPLMSRWPLAHPLSIGTVTRRRLGVVGAGPAGRRGTVGRRPGRERGARPRRARADRRRPQRA